MSIFEEAGGTYTVVNGYLIPCLSYENSAPIGHWGRMRKQYLREHHPALFSAMLLDGTLYPHLTEIDRSARERLEQSIPALAARRGVTEQLKADDPLKWVREMNLIRAVAEEAILSELVYCE